MGSKPLATGPRSEALAAFIVYALEEAGMSRARLEERASISHNRLAVLLRGERPMTIEELIRICDALGIRPSRALDAVEEAIPEASGGPTSVPPEWELAAQDVPGEADEEDAALADAGA